jgi:tetratricopeptide (TPR) repeat protein
MRAALFSGILLLLVSCSDSEKPKKQIEDTQTIDELFKKYPDSLDIIIKHGNTLLTRYDYDNALKDGAKAFRLDSNNLEARFLYANALNNRASRTFSDVLTAQRHFQVVVNKQPKNTRALVALGSTFAQQQDFKQAFAYVNEALRIDKHYRDAYVMKGSMYLSMDERELAKSSYQTAIEQDPDFFEAYIFLGDIYMHEGNPLCIDYYRSAVKLKPNSMDALYSLAYGYQQTKQYEKALGTYREMVKKDKSFAPSYFQQGHIKQFGQNQPDSASYYYFEALRVEPRYVEAWHNLGYLSETKGDRSKALEYYSKALHYDPEFQLTQEAVDRLR